MTDTTLAPADEGCVTSALLWLDPVPDADEAAGLVQAMVEARKGEGG